MKKYATLILSLFAFNFAIVAQEKVGGPEIEFEKEVHDFGKLQAGADAVVNFKFKNTGNEPLIISNARGSCGCTVPEWPREPIAPGQSGSIKVSYDSKRIGPINKSVTITSNSASNPNKVIRIKGNVDQVQDAMPVSTPAAVPGAQ